jgi:hypothetical protein
MTFFQDGFTDSQFCCEVVLQADLDGFAKDPAGVARQIR